MENYKAKGEIMKINLVVEKCWWFWGQNKKERVETESKICMKIDFSVTQPNSWISTRR